MTFYAYIHHFASMCVIIFIVILFIFALLFIILVIRFIVQKYKNICLSLKYCIINLIVNFK